MTKLIVLDRDGVINQDSDDFIKTPDEWVALPGSLEAIAMLAQGGYSVAVATNQSGLGRGLFDKARLEDIHAKMREEAVRAGGRIDHIVYCPHRPDDGCDCRKPNPGLLLQLAQHFSVDMSGVPFVGDSMRDIDAARAAGARPILVLTGNGNKARAQLESENRAVDTYMDLQAVALALTGAAKEG